MLFFALFFAYSVHVVEIGSSAGIFHAIISQPDKIRLACISKLRESEHFFINTLLS